MKINKNVLLLDGYEITGEIYTFNGMPWVWFAIGNGSGVKFPITCIADIENALGTVLKEAVKYEEAQLEGE